MYNELRKKVKEMLNRLFDAIDAFVENYLLDMLVRIPWLENRIRSYRLTEKDIKIMSSKGYKIFDGDKGRFVKEIPEVLKQRMI